MKVKYNIQDFLQELEDPRRGEGKRHTLEDLVTMILMAILSNHQSVRGVERFVKANEKELTKILNLKHGVPSYQTIQHMFHLLNAQQAAKKFSKWMQTYADKLGDECLSLDGKTLRGTVKNSHNSAQNFIAVVSAFGHRSKMVYGMQSYDNKKSAEASVVRDLIGVLGLEDKLFTLDALHCEKKL